MRFSILLGCSVAAWLFVAAVTAVDIHWALRYRESAELWESNPVMLRVMQDHGVETAAAVRAGTVVFAAVMMCFASWGWRLTATGVTTAAHAYLAAAYAMIYAGNPFHG